MPDTDLSKVDFVKLRRFCDQWSEGVHLRQHGAELTSRYTDKEMSQLTFELMHRPDITSLDLSYNNIGDEGVSHLAHCLELGWPLRRLNLMNNCLVDGGAKMLVHAMCHASRPSRLHTLRLSGNRLGSRAAEHLAHLLARPECPLRDLDVAHTDLTPRGLCHVLASLGQPCCRLQRLVLDRPLLATAGDCDYAADLLNRTLQANTSLQQLSVRQFCLGDQQMHVLLEGLSRHRSLRRLDLSCNQLRVDGARWLAHVLRTSPVLEEVHTCHNHLGTSGAKHLAEEL